MAKQQEVEEIDDADEKAGIVRSPRYPAISLREAVAKVKTIYDADKTAGTPTDAALRHMGYKSRSGPALTTIAALKRFGLIETRGGRAYPTSRAVTILRLPENDIRRKKALAEAALAPQIYQELFDRYKDTGLP